MYPLVTNEKLFTLCCMWCSRLKCKVVKSIDGLRARLGLCALRIHFYFYYQFRLIRTILGLSVVRFCQTRGRSFAKRLARHIWVLNVRGSKQCVRDCRRDAGEKKLTCLEKQLLNLFVDKFCKENLDFSANSGIDPLDYVWPPCFHVQALVASVRLPRHAYWSSFSGNWVSGCSATSLVSLLKKTLFPT